jgi:Fe-S-cluster-containing dehydrogenase component/anaerobic selenocysteine-containing dehydrogenase
MMGTTNRGPTTDELPPSAGLSRRDFFSLVGATTALAATVACERKGQTTVVPYTKRPVEVIPGVANYYASTFQEGRRIYPVLVKTREGRPIHVTGNGEHGGVKGKASPRAMADVLRLYDPDRLRAPRFQGRAVSWADAESRLGNAFRRAKADGRSVLLITGPVASPSRKALIADFMAELPTLKHLAWDAAAGDAAEVAARDAFGRAVEIVPRLDKAQVILSLGSDFLNGSDVEAVAAFASKRRLGRSGEAMSRLWVFEGPMTLTGSNADQRIPVKPSRLAPLAFALAKELNTRHAIALPAGADLSAVPAGMPRGVDIPARTWTRLVDDLAAARRGAVVLCGAEMPAEAHIAAHLLNAMLGSEVVEVRGAEPLASRTDLESATRDMTSGACAAAILWDVNPALAFPQAAAWKDAFAKVPFRAWIGLIEDESSVQCDLVLPENHWLESWGDFGFGSVVTMQQPTIGTLYDTRQGEDILLAGIKSLGLQTASDYHAYLQSRWRTIVQRPGNAVSFDRFFQAALHDGLVRTGSQEAAAPSFIGASVAPAATRAAASPRDLMELVLFPGFATYDGRYANNGWLQECPDPVTKVTWDNPVLLSAADARELGIADGVFVTIDTGHASVRVPALIQPGQAEGVLALALGYGRSSGSVAAGVGVNAFALMNSDPTSANLRTGVRISLTGGSKELARTQRHHRMEGRELARSYTVAEFEAAARTPRHEPELASLYPDQQFPEHKWGMAIDLSACVGCSACVLACQSENNVSVVGAEQVTRGREMHWIRIDRYYEGNPANPRTVHQPMLCQQCDSAPCENVCPVAATNHSPDGLNQMVYNRCVGTRYCANNCPYKVRRFNFLEYTAPKTEPATLVYNPEVTVRPRGVMEKCTFCVQRIQDAKIRAKGEGRPLRDGEIVTACMAGCPTDAIVFGDLKDPKSMVSQLAGERRAYKVLEEVGARPSITYLTDLKNPAVDGVAHE